MSVVPVRGIRSRPASATRWDPSRRVDAVASRPHESSSAEQSDEAVPQQHAATGAEPELAAGGVDHRLERFDDRGIVRGVHLGRLEQRHRNAGIQGVRSARTRRATHVRANGPEIGWGTRMVRRGSG